MFTSKSRTIAAAVAAVMALGAVTTVPAAAGDYGYGQSARAAGLTDVSSRGRSNAAALGMFGAVVGTIAAVAAANAYRNSQPYYQQGYYQQPQPYYGGGYGYARPVVVQPGYGYGGGWRHGWHHRHW